jgi:hypothetical protein
MFKKLVNNNLSLGFIAFLQATGISVYCGLVGLIFWWAETWFGKMTNYLGPVLMLLLLCVSVLICALIGLGYPFLLFWEEKKTKDALRLVGYTAAWLVFYVLLIMLLLLVY